MDCHSWQLTDQNHNRLSSRKRDTHLLCGKPIFPRHRLNAQLALAEPRTEALPAALSLCAILGVPPFGHSTQLRVFVDLDLLQYDEVWAAAGTWNDNFGAAPADIVRVAGGVVTDLKRA
jgi:hypothetical protein